MARKPRSVALTLDQRVFQPYKKVGLADDHHDAAKAAFLLGRDGIALPELLRPLSSHTVLGRAAPLGPFLLRMRRVLGDQQTSDQNHRPC